VWSEFLDLFFKTSKEQDGDYEWWQKLDENGKMREKEQSVSDK
jgi:hypothetical protein